MRFKFAFVAAASAFTLSGCFLDSHHSSNDSNANPANALVDARGFSSQSTDRWAFYVDGNELYAVDGNNLDAGPVLIDTLSLPHSKNEAFADEELVHIVDYQPYTQGERALNYRDIIYLKEGKLFKVSSNATDIPAPVQLSNVSNLPALCTKPVSYGSQTAAENAALLVSLKGDQSGCGSFDMNNVAQTHDINYFIPLTSTASAVPLLSKTEMDGWQAAHAEKVSAKNPNCPYSLDYDSEKRLTSVNQKTNEQTVLSRSITVRQIMPNRNYCAYLIQSEDNGERGFYLFNAENNQLSEKLLAGNWDAVSRYMSAVDFYLLQPGSTSSDANSSDSEIQLAKIDSQTGQLAYSFSTGIPSDEWRGASQFEIISEDDSNLYFTHAAGPAQDNALFYKNLGTSEKPTQLTDAYVLSAFNLKNKIVGNEIQTQLLNLNDQSSVDTYLNTLKSLQGAEQIDYMAKYLPNGYEIDKSNRNVSTRATAPIWTSCTALNGFVCDSVLGYSVTLRNINFDADGLIIPYEGPASTSLVKLDSESSTPTKLATFQASSLALYTASNLHAVLGETKAATFGSINQGDEKHELFAFP
ncbi:MAG TPA: hypothetical protein VFM46_14870, partial [Pseudomonadales bacterium]|nr:hypothetical protein [Pseudomonadales bacterium]